MLKIGIFGGAFNPVHNGHIQLAAAVNAALSLDKMLVIPTKESPHKATKLADFESRAELCRLAFAEIPNVEISEIEREFNGKSYTINTVYALKKVFGNAEFFLIMGGDMLFYLPKWYKYEELLRECKIVAAARHEGEYQELLKFAKQYGDRVSVLNAPVIDVSSTEIRGKIRQGKDINGLVPQSVRRFIELNGLYKEQN